MLKVVAYVNFPDGSRKQFEDLNDEEKEMLAFQINSAPAKVMGFKVKKGA